MAAAAPPRVGVGVGVLSPDHPPYCCCILHEAKTGALLLEVRGADAKVAASALTCFGGKREPDEAPLACIRRELSEELGLDSTTAAADAADAAAGTKGGNEAAAPSAKRAKPVPSVRLRRAVDLYVDDELIAWFYEAQAPPRDAPLVYEEGRRGVWLEADDEEAQARSLLSPWHAAVLAAWRRGEARADFVTPATE